MATLLAPSASAACGDADGRLRVATFNLQFTRAFRSERQIGPLAARLVAQPVDILLLQEVAGGLVIGGESLAHVLAERIAAQDGPRYQVAYAPASGVAGFFTVGNAVLSRCPILARRTTPLPEIAELSLAGGRWRLARNVLRVDVQVGSGQVVHVFDTHLCAGCAPADRGRQLDIVLAAVRSAIAGEAPVILGGDFNIDRLRDGGAEQPLYESILRAGLRDTAGSGVRGYCDRPGRPDAFCTVGVADPWRPESRRIDYIFVRGLGIAAHGVIFNPRVDPEEAALSNHAAVTATVLLPREPGAGHGHAVQNASGRVP